MQYKQDKLVSKLSLKYIAKPKKQRWQW